MKKTTVCLALALTILAAPLAAADYRISERSNAPLAGLWARVVGLFKHQLVIVNDGVPVESTGADVHGKLGVEVILDGSAESGEDKPTGNGRPNGHGSHIIADG